MTSSLSPEYLVSLGKEFGTPLYVYHEIGRAHV